MLVVLLFKVLTVRERRKRRLWAHAQHSSSSAEHDHDRATDAASLKGRADFD
jgi:hypothetical protein